MSQTLTTVSDEANKLSKANTSQVTDAPEAKASVLTQEELRQSRGANQYYRHLHFFYTEGVHNLAEKAEAYWLLDAIASYQPKLEQDAMLKHFQIWTLQVDLDKQTAVLICEKDANEVVLTQKISWTDFPLEKVQLYLIDQVLLLPGEY